MVLIHFRLENEDLPIFTCTVVDIQKDELLRHSQHYHVEKFVKSTVSTTSKNLKFSLTHLPASFPRHNFSSARPIGHNRNINCRKSWLAYHNQRLFLLIQTPKTQPVSQLSSKPWRKVHHQETSPVPRSNPKPRLQHKSKLLLPRLNPYWRR